MLGASERAFVVALLLVASACGSRGSDNIDKAEVRRACADPGATATFKGSCSRIKGDSVAAVIDHDAESKLKGLGFDVRRISPAKKHIHVAPNRPLPDLTPPVDDFFAAEIGFASTTSRREIDQVQLPAALANVTTSEAPVLASIKAAIWLTTTFSPHVRWARPIFGLRSTYVATSTTDDSTAYPPKGDALSDTYWKNMRQLESWQLLQFARYQKPQVTLAIVDSGFSDTNSDLDNPLNVGNIGAPGPDGKYHGHWVASIAGGVSNNSALVAGTSALAASGLDWVGATPSLRIMRVHLDPRLWDTDIAWGITEAVEMGADVINLSLGGNCDAICQFFGFEVLSPIGAALDYARLQAVTTIAGAGNDGANLDSNDWQYTPCEAGRERVVCVGAVDRSNQVATGWPSSLCDSASCGSNFGSAISVFAPGDSVPAAPSPGSTGLTLATGTSFAAPYVAGVVASVSGSEGASRKQERRRALGRYRRADQRQPDPECRGIHQTRRPDRDR
jgi:subtilisin family serine protease